MIDVNTLVAACQGPYSNAAVCISSSSAGGSDMGEMSRSLDGSVCNELPGEGEVPMDVDVLAEQPSEVLIGADVSESGFPAPPVTPIRPVLTGVNGKYPENG